MIKNNYKKLGKYTIYNKSKTNIVNYIFFSLMSITISTMRIKIQ